MNNNDICSVLNGIEDGLLRDFLQRSLETDEDKRATLEELLQH